MGKGVELTDAMLALQVYGLIRSTLTLPCQLLQSKVHLGLDIHPLIPILEILAKGL